MGRGKGFLAVGFFRASPVVSFLTFRTNCSSRTALFQACFLRACRAWRAPGPWLGCGAACLRLEQWEEAEDALQHASRLNCNSSLVWGHLALLLLSLGEDR